MILRRIKTVISLILTFLLITIPTLNSFAIVNNPSSLNLSNDENYYDIKEHWAENDIKGLLEKGIVNGKSDESGRLVIKPNDSITRAEFMTLIVKTLFTEENLKEEIENLTGEEFTDVNSHWAKDYIKLARKYGLTKGYEDGTFKPDKKISRAEIVSMVVRASKYKDEDLDSSFNDVDKSHWAYRYISIAYMKGIIKGYDSGKTFKPFKLATRAEAMVIIKRCLDTVILSIDGLESNKDIESIEDKFKLEANKKSVYKNCLVNIKLKEENVNAEYKTNWTANGGKLEISEDNRSAVWLAENVDYKDYTITVEITINENGEEKTFKKSISINVKRRSSKSSGRNNSTHDMDPTAPVISIKVENSNVVLTWDEVPGATSYTVKRGKSSGQYSVLKSDITENTYIDDTVDETTTYYYVVTATNGTEESSNSNEVVYKVAPQEPILFGSLSGTTATLNWTKSNGADSYQLYRSSVDGGPYILLQENLLSNIYEDTGLIEGNIYYYVAKAVNDIGESDYSNQVILGTTVTQQNTFNPDIDDDGDGLSNSDELTYGTNYRLADTDNDGLTDGYEIQIGTDPLDPDTDGDGIYDGAETTAGIDPLTASASVSATKKAQTSDGTVVVVAKGDANLLIAPLQVTQSDNVLLNSLEGIVGKPIDITIGGFNIDEATITIEYDEDDLNGISEDDLTLFYVNPETKQLEELADTVVDKDNNTITATTTHFSTYLLGDKNMPIDLSNVDIIFTIDQSGSMGWNDPNYYRIDATKKFIEKMDVDNSRIGIVEFTSSAKIKQALTNDKATLINVINSMKYKGGGTNIGEALVVSGDMYDDDSRKKIMVLLTDGENSDDSYETITYIEADNLATESVVINSVALGSDSDTDLLQDIATTTKGGYFYIDNTGGLSQEDVDKQIELLYEKLSKQLTLQLEAEDNNSLPIKAVNLEFSDLYKGYHNKEIQQWITNAQTNILTGNYMDVQKDIYIESTGIDLTFERTYNSFSAKDKTVIGNGFRTNYDSSIEATTGTGIVQASMLNVRDEPSTSTGKIIYQVTKGTQLEILEENISGSEWHKIEYTDTNKNVDVEAYVAGWYIEELNDALKVTYASGTAITFKEDSNGEFIAPSNTNDTLEKENGQYILTQKDLTKYIYDETSGDLTSIEDRNGNILTVEYSSDKISKVSDSVGRSLKFTYSGNSIIKVTDPIGRTVEYSYDSNGNLTKVKDSLGNETTYAYDTLGRINKVTDANNHQVTRNEYDIIGRIVRQYDGQDNIKYYIYDDTEKTRYYIDENANESKAVFNADFKPIEATDTYGNTISYQYYVRYNDEWVHITDLKEDTDAYTDYVENMKDEKLEKKKNTIDKRGNTTVSEYDERDNLVKVTDSLLNEVVMTYDDNDNLISKTDKKQNSTIYEYDGQGINLVRVTDALSNEVEYTYATNTTIKGLVQTEKDKLGNVTTYKYEDSYNNLTSVLDSLNNEITFQYDNVGRKIKSIDAKGYETSLEYDNMDRLIKETDHYGNTIINEYDNIGNVIATTDRNGNTTEYEYDEENQVIKTTDPMGAETQYSYDSVGNKVKEIDPLNRETKYTYDALNRVTKITDSESKEVTFEYDVGDNKIKEIDQLGRETTFTYDVLNRLTQVEDALGYTEKYIYDANDNIAAFKNKNSKYTNYSYDALNRVIEVEDPLYNTEKYTYDSNGNKLTHEDKNNNSTTYEYDKLNRLITQTAPNGGVTAYEYDANGNQIKVIDPFNRETVTVYDELNRPITVTDVLDNEITYKYDAVSNKTEEIDARGNSTKYEYDKLSRVIKVTDELGNHSSMEYDAVGNNIVKTDKRGNQTEYVYDDLNRLKQSIDVYGNITYNEYDSVGNEIASIDPKGNEVSYIYDDLNRLTKIIDQNNYTTYYEYDGVGNKIEETDPKGNTTEFDYDALSRLTKVTDRENNETWYSYDDGGNLLTQTNSNNNTTAYEYNDINKPVKIIDAEDNEEIYSYDLAGNLTMKVDRNGVTTTNQYDELYRITQVTVGDVTIDYSYDEVGNRTSMIDSIGTTTYEYDELNRLVKETLPDSKSISYEYDQQGNKTKVTDHSGEVTEYTYDKMNRLEAVTTTEGVTTYEYDENGSRKSLEYPNGAKTEYEYDYRNLLTLMTATISDTETVIEDVYYSPSNINDLGGSKVTIEYEYSYGYDKNGNQIYKEEPTGRTEYTYDNLNRLKTVIDPYGRETTYIYDKVGNRIKEEISITSTITEEQLLSDGMPSDTVSESVYGAVYGVDKFYTYDNNNRLLSLIKKDAEGNTVKEIEYTYDDNGNQIKVGETTDGIVKDDDFRYDELNRLIEVTKDGKTMAYTYNGDGLRRTKKVDDITTTFYYTGKKVIYEKDSTGNQYSNIHGINRIARSDGSQIGYYLYNGHADVVLMVDENGLRKNIYDYDAFGNIIRQVEEGINNPYRYTEYYYDEETDYYYLRARFYNPYIGRFISEDSYKGDVNYPLSLNLYTYTYNNPIKYIDPSGNIVETVVDIASIGWSAYDMWNDPSWANAGFLLWDIGSAVVPFVPGSYVGKGAKALNKVDEVGEGFAKLYFKNSDEAAEVIAKGTGEAALKYWDEAVEVNGIKVYGRKDLIDPDMVDSLGRTNLQRMESGIAPIGPDGKSINLHHMIQTNDSAIAEVTQTFHQQNSKVIHINPNTTPSGINRSQFNKWKKNYWKNRVNDFK